MTNLIFVEPTLCRPLPFSDMARSSVPWAVVLPLLGAAIMLQVLASRYPGSSLLPALSVEALSLAFVILIVDRLLERHERNRWADADAFLDNHLKTLANFGLYRIRAALAHPEPEIARRIIRGEWTSDDVEAALYSDSATQFAPALRDLYSATSYEQRRRLRRTLKRFRKRCQRTIRLYGARLSPDDLATVHFLYDLAGTPLSTLEIFRELIDEEAPKYLDASEEFRETSVTVMATRLEELVLALCKLGQAKKRTHFEAA